MPSAFRPRLINWPSLTVSLDMRGTLSGGSTTSPKRAPRIPSYAKLPRFKKSVEVGLACDQANSQPNCNRRGWADDTGPTCVAGMTTLLSPLLALKRDIKTVANTMKHGTALTGTSGSRLRVPPSRPRK